ncbi:bifunctional [glutamate--ammonia ligase]-adenylyl-L-tyrosine phosphorylase/[glutamate--ammonia-ligase] adenylyltransferase [Methylococcus sp. EFPC2]|uniref:bifunctional [glutamate--ammonia ligase]-adenylyl-L-tyrosine phosphorylase/[glutamate--ammonia-ligase] adenylyltransferase n=1 Tax=Methylococcus sp. EFPC2 TaxID=2812648 RepID=UPI0019684380|nr:bifunctional [glutamate--ammonia ligase]-adenylyl-L-tyrosine phosphorylase/[glutamate--ammonia-ligase] adenylyltransferase [Methylococcus sp. EFPC2]QSA98974.1 bifunctional [glutamate--ammonia ligase]-adenylyl-L-tyrosine phosphorylase/[glutamate--ammonia-ligase] adenylyltransferase [Methylococcus sp. EFPC2]
MQPRFTGLPAELKLAAENLWADFLASGIAIPDLPVERGALLEGSLGTVWAASPFVAEQCVRRPASWFELLTGELLFEARAESSCRRELAALLAGAGTEAELMAILRYFRNREMVRVAWRDIAGWANLDETLADLSNLAEACVAESLEWLFLRACELRGTPLNRGGQPQRLVVLGMGKLGARELNYSSDIDLIFAYEEEGQLPDKKETSYSEFYTRLGRSLVKVLDEVTGDGFVFRVDMRLRPFGDAGPLAMSFDAMERYYQSQAREWERYAMVKARAIAGDAPAIRALDDIRRPFVYRRYLDYRAFGELRELKRKIALELQRKDRQDNVKLGPGGIREIEFIGQAFQLIRGGQEKRLRERDILTVLDRLGELEHLPRNIVQRLKEAYRFLRLTENRIQQYADQQTHDLPADPLRRLALAHGMGYADWNGFKAALDAVRLGVHEIFEQVISAPQTAEGETENRQWLEQDDAMWRKSLIELGLREPEPLLPLLLAFGQSTAIRRVTTRGAAELNRIMPLLLRAVGGVQEPAETLARILKVLEAIAGRNVYFTLLAENPLALSQLVKLAAASSWITQYIADHPLLLDDLLDPAGLYTPLSREQLRAELDARLGSVDTGDTEQLMTVLRQFKQSNVLRIAVADIMGVIPIMVVSDYLTWLAEVLVEEALARAWQQTCERHGPPPGGQGDRVQGFAVIAYGKAGGIELGYASDLDLVFLYGGVDDNAVTQGASPIPSAQFYARVAKRMISILTTQMLSGALYEIDLRLRPSGSSGLLVSSLAAYQHYQLHESWTWEQQALVRARFIAGDPAVGERFLAIRRQSLARPREIGTLRREVREMREKMRINLEHKDSALFDLKQGAGGIADIEFLVQFGVLSGASEHPDALTRWTDVVRLLESLRDSGFLSADDAALLKQAYCRYRELGHRAALLDQSALAPPAEFADLRDRVLSIWRTYLEG